MARGRLSFTGAFPKWIKNVPLGMLVIGRTCLCNMTDPWSGWRKGVALFIPDLSGAGWRYYWTKGLFGNLSQMAGGRLSFAVAFPGWLRSVREGLR